MNDEAPPDRGLARYRPLLVVALFVGLLIAGKLTGIVDRLDPDAVRALVAKSGPFGMLLFVAVFSVGELVHVPGMVFVGAAILLWGKVIGFAVCMVSSLVSISVSFFVVRAVGGKALTTMRSKLVRRMLVRLDSRPVLTVAVLRAVFWLSPPLNYALAMTGIRYRDYLAGSALGLVLPLLGVSLLFDWWIG